MKSSNKLLISEGVVILALMGVQLQGAVVTVPNGSFEEVYKPGSTTVTADLGGGWTNGVGLGAPMNGSQTAAYSDGTTGSTVDIPGWINTPGWKNSYDTAGPGSLSRQGSTPYGEHYYLANGSNWGNPQGGAIESAAPLALILAGQSYTVSMFVNSDNSPVLLELLANGSPLTPTSLVDPAGPPFSWNEVSRSYDAASLAGHVGEELTIRVGFGVDAAGSQIDDPPNAVGSQGHIDNVSLSFIPEPAVISLLVIGGLALLRRRRS